MKKHVTKWKTKWLDEMLEMQIEFYRSMGASEELLKEWRELMQTKVHPLYLKMQKQMKVGDQCSK